eukprot:9234250-Karenia_brevis.AAC.1
MMMIIIIVIIVIIAIIIIIIIAVVIVIIINRNADVLHPNKKQIVIDGRLRGRVSRSRPMSLFWLVARAKDDEKANMEVGYASCEINAHVIMPGCNHHHPITRHGQ